MANPLYIPGPNSAYKDDSAKFAGFFDGLWHGVIAGAVFVASLFDDGVRIYETNNAGQWYDFGFLIGIGAQIPGIYVGVVQIL